MTNDQYLRAAFDLVCPATRAKALVASGKWPADLAAEVSWRDRIVAIVTDSQLATAGVDIDDVRVAVVHFTATTATITREMIALEHGSEPGYLVLAAGYRAGPAGP